MNTIHLPDNVRTIISALEAHGYEAYAVGGCVRDSLLGIEPKDWDITTGAEPQKVKTVFRRCIDTGIRHGTVTIMLGGEGYEVTTFRIDGDYSDGRHPDSVTFTENLREDLRRRDFTINAMAYSDRSGVVDLFGGAEDLEKGLIRAVGEPEERFSEDALRILRMVRFAAQLGFEIEKATFLAARKLSGNLRMVSAERIREEFLKTLLSDHPGKLLDLEKIGALSAVLPELSAVLRESRSETVPDSPETGHPETERSGNGASPEERILQLSGFPGDKVFRLAELFVIIGRAEGIGWEVTAKLADARLRALKFDNETREQTVYLVRYFGLPLDPDARALRHTLSIVGKDGFPRLLHFRELHRTDEPETDFRAVFEAFRGILERGECVSVPELAVTGNDLIETGMKPGKAIGGMLRKLLFAVLDDPSLNDRKTLLGIAAGQDDPDS